MDKLKTLARQASLLGMSPETHQLSKVLSQTAHQYSTTLRGLRAEYERYLYQALGRKVDFEECNVEKGHGLHYIVKALFIVLKGNTEPMAPRFYVNLSIMADEASELPNSYKVEVNAGFINAIGMSHSKFHQSGCESHQLADPSRLFGWIEYLDGDFFSGKRIVKPFAQAPASMGTVTACEASGTHYDILGDLQHLTAYVAQERGFPAGALSFFHQKIVLTLVAHLDSRRYYDEASMVRDALIMALQTEVPRQFVPVARFHSELLDFCNSALNLEGDCSLSELKQCLSTLAALVQALGAVPSAAKIQRAMYMLSHS